MKLINNVFRRFLRKASTNRTTSGVILSYPRSGNHLVRYYIEFATGRPTLGYINNRKDIPMCENSYCASQSPLSHVSGTAEFSKFHRPDQIYNSEQKSRIAQTKKLIVVVRNPLECIARHAGYDWTNETVKNHAIAWTETLLYFRSFVGLKHLVQYEKLICDSKIQELETLLYFVNAEPNLMAKLFSGLAEYTELNRTATNRSWAGSISNNQINFHLERVSRKQEFIKIVGEIVTPIISEFNLQYKSLEL